MPPNCMCNVYYCQFILILQLYFDCGSVLISVLLQIIGIHGRVDCGMIMRRNQGEFLKTMFVTAYGWSGMLDQWHLESWHE